MITRGKQINLKLKNGTQFNPREETKVALLQSKLTYYTQTILKFPMYRLI